MEYNKKMIRLVVYATYDKEGIVDDYILYCLNELYKSVPDIIVIGNHALSTEQSDRLVGITEEIYEREDTGYDMGGFAYVVGLLKSQDRLKNYDEIIFMNDSVFGPFYPFNEMLSAMDKRHDLDFWGITKRGESDFDGGDTIYPEHIQLYFYAVRRNMLNSAEFMSYWDEIPNKVTDFRSAILNYEFAFTKYFSDRGFKWDVYCQTDSYVTNNPQTNLSPYHYCSYNLIKNGRCPLLKRKLFTGDFVDGRYSDRSDLRKALDYIDKHTNYDIRLIWSHILRIYPLGNIMESLQMVEFMAMEDRFDQCDKTYGTIIRKEDAVSKLGEQKGYTLYISLETTDGKAASLINAEESCIMDNFMPNNTYMAKVELIFTDKPMLGVLIPPMKTFGKISKSIKRKWQDMDKALEIYRKYKLSIPFEETAPIYKIDSFWCRNDILSEKLLYDLKNDNTGTVLQMIPLIAQQKGYYTEILVNINYAASLLTNMQRTLYDIWEMVLCDSDIDMDLKEMQDLAYAKKILEFSQENKKLYIYGAGELACRVIKIVEKIRKLDGIVVSDRSGNADMVFGYHVSEIDEIDADAGHFIIAVGRKNNHVIVDKMRKMGISDYLLLA